MNDRSDDYEIGYGKPPAHSRWVKGQSGNPKGRARGKRGVKTDLARAIDGQQIVVIKGEEIKDSRQALTLLMLASRAAAGDVKAASILVPLIIQTFGLEDRGKANATLSPGDAALLREYLNGVPPGEAAAAPGNSAEEQADVALEPDAPKNGCSR